jgi:hypothetical protein
MNFGNLYFLNVRIASWKIMYLVSKFVENREMLKKNSEACIAALHGSNFWPLFTL